MKWAASVGLASCLASALSGQEAASPGKSALLRGLDKVSGEVTDFEIGNGGSASLGMLKIEMRECRYPQGNAAGDAFAFVTIRDQDSDQPTFSGWMIASSPALNALDHARYDVWVLRCKTD